MYSPEKDEVVALFLDSTETIRAHRALDRSEKLFKNIFANIPAGVEIYDKDGNLLDLNNWDMETFGVKVKADVRESTSLRIRMCLLKSENGYGTKIWSISD